MSGGVAADAHGAGAVRPAGLIAQTAQRRIASTAPAIEWLAPAEISASHWADWQALANRTTEANVFAEPWMVRAGLDHCNERAGAKIAFVRDADGRLIGVAPMHVASGFGRLPVQVALGWSHPNSFLTTLLVAEGQACAFWLRLINTLAQGPLAAPILCCDGLPEGGALHQGLVDACRRLRLPLSAEGAVTRAMLATKMDPEAYWEDSVRAKKRKELRRQWARLNEQGDLTTDQLTAAEGQPLEQWIEQFLSLEATGWKGANGSALLSNADTAEFFRTTMVAAHAAGQLEMTALRLDGRAIAVLITLFSGQAGFSFKTAFDENYARYSPGVLLQRESLSILSQRGLDWIDSCAAQDHPMIDSLWRERRTIVSMALPLPGPRNRLIFAGTQAATKIWHAAKRLRAPTATSPTLRSDPQPGPAPAGSVQDDDA